MKEMSFVAAAAYVSDRKQRKVGQNVQCKCSAES